MGVLFHHSPCSSPLPLHPDIFIYFLIFHIRISSPSRSRRASHTLSSSIYSAQVTRISPSSILNYCDCIFYFPLFLLALPVLSLFHITTNPCLFRTSYRSLSSPDVLVCLSVFFLCPCAGCGLPTLPFLDFLTTLSTYSHLQYTVYVQVALDPFPLDTSFLYCSFYLSSCLLPLSIVY